MMITYHLSCFHLVELLLHYFESNFASACLIACLFNYLRRQLFAQAIKVFHLHEVGNIP